jgi:hypothetical protein
VSYSLILFVEKVAFNSHALIEHDHGEGGHAHGHEKEHDDAKELKNTPSKTPEKHGHKHEHAHQGHEEKGNLKDLQKRQENLERFLPKEEEHIHHDHEEESDDSDLEEETIKNAVSSRGKFASFMYMKNKIDRTKTSESFVGQPAFKNDKALQRASILLQKTLTKSVHNPEYDRDDMDLMVNPNKIKNPSINQPGMDQPYIAEVPELQTKSNLTAVLLLIALSLHGFFEGIALGIQSDVADTLFLALVVLTHKWAEAFTLVS